MTSNAPAVESVLTRLNSTGLSAKRIAGLAAMFDSAAKATIEAPHNSFMAAADIRAHAKRLLHIDDVETLTLCVAESPPEFQRALREASWLCEADDVDYVGGLRRALAFVNTPDKRPFPDWLRAIGGAPVSGAGKPEQVGMHHLLDMAIAIFEDLADGKAGRSNIETVDEEEWPLTRRSGRFLAFVTELLAIYNIAAPGDKTIRAAIKRRKHCRLVLKT